MGYGHRTYYITRDLNINRHANPVGLEYKPVPEYAGQDVVRLSLILWVNGREVLDVIGMNFWRCRIDEDGKDADLYPLDMHTALPFEEVKDPELKDYLDERNEYLRITEDEFRAIGEFLINEYPEQEEDIRKIINYHYSQSINRK